MIHLAIQILWLLIGVIILCGIVYFALMVIKTFVPLDALIERAVWLVVLILILIGALSLLAGGDLRATFHLGTAVLPQLALA